MSKKDYEQIAERLRKMPLEKVDREVVAAMLSQVFKEGNPRFDPERFLLACRPDGEGGALDPDTLTRILIDYLIQCGRSGEGPSLESILDVARESAASVERLADPRGGPK